MATIANGSNRPINVQTGTVPDVSGALTDWFQPMTFSVVEKETIGFQVVETATPVSFRGVIQPFSPRELQMKPEGQRSWTWSTLHSDPSLTLDTDEVVIYNEVQYRVMSRRDFTIYGYVQYELVQDYTGAGPEDAE